MFNVIPMQLARKRQKGLHYTPAGGPLGVPGNWTQVFSDDFNGASLDLTKWRPNWLAGTDTALSKAPNSNEDGYMDPAQVTLEDGWCVFRSAATPPTVVQGITYNYKTGLIQTLNDGHIFSVPFFAEARMDIEASSGSTVTNWPIFWTNGDHPEPPGWPKDGEFDIAECGSPGVMKTNVHFDADGDDDDDPAGGQALPGNTTGIHVAGAYVQNDTVDFYWDGTLARTYSHANLPNAPQYLILSLGIPKSGYAGPLKDPGIMRVDYCKVWTPV